MDNMTESVREALESTQIDPRDVGAAEVCRRYAALIDAPGRPERYRKHLNELAALVRREGTGEQAAAFDAIQAALSEQSVASDLGPKLLAGLTALGLTPAGRGEKGKAEERAPDPQRAAHDELKARRAQRKHGAAAVDPSA